MMTYQYQCNDCKKKFDMKISMNDDVPKTPICPKCGSNDTKRLWNVPEIVYNADGFSVKDNLYGTPK